MATATVDTDVIELTIGEGDDRLITFRDPALTDPDNPDADLIRLDQATDATADRFAVVRFAVKRNPSRQSNANADIFKTSYRDDEIAIQNQAVVATQGRAMLKIDEPDTTGKKPSDDYCYEVFLTRQDVLRPGASVGTIDALADGTGAVTGTGTAFLNAKPGDVLTVVGGANDLAVSRIQTITDNGTMILERTTWSAQTTVTFEIRRGAGRTATVRDENGDRVKIGQLKLVQDVVGQS
jgi:hypothetical protein